MSIWLLNIIVFLASFLLFQIELIIAKFYLPYFGGTYVVWGACVVFFQATLLLGYLNAHVVLKRVGMSRYRLVLIVFLCLPFLFFPGRDLSAPSVNIDSLLVLNVFGQLILSIGVVFFVLSTMSIVLQAWLSQSKLPQRDNPYALFAVSNVGSFAALLTYPFFFEAQYSLDEQVHLWRIGYFALVLCNVLAIYLVRLREKIKVEIKDESSIPIKVQARWFILGAGGVVMFLSVTDLITSIVVPIALFWTIPLTIYLISFTLNFKRKPWCPKWITDKISLTLGFGALIYFLAYRAILPLIVLMLVYCFVLFIVCMYCQRELYRTRPRDHKDLSYFYVVFSAGAFLGGILVSWIMPLVASTLIDFLLGLVLVGLSVVWDAKPAKFQLRHVRYVIYLMLMITFWPLIFPKYHFGGIALITLFFYMLFKAVLNVPRVALTCLVCVLVMAPSLESSWTKESEIERIRNYYGVYKIVGVGRTRMLVHTNINHGIQYTDKNRQMIPTTYFSPLTAVGRILSSDSFNFKRMGVIGLGAGTLAAYLKDDQRMDFFELDKDVYTIARKYFTYLKGAKGEIKHYIGDGRLMLDQVPKKVYDVLIVDAYGGVSVPVHLLSVEAIAKFREHVKDDGIVMFHISNRFMKLGNVLVANIVNSGGYVVMGITADDAKTLTYKADYVVATWDEEQYKKIIAVKGVSWIPAKNVKYIKRLWTDQYSNPLSVLMTKSLADELKNFKPFRW